MTASKYYSYGEGAEQGPNYSGGEADSGSPWPSHGQKILNQDQDQGQGYYGPSNTYDQQQQQQQQLSSPQREYSEPSGNYATQSYQYSESYAQSQHYNQSVSSPPPPPYGYGNESQYPPQREEQGQQRYGQDYYQYQPQTGVETPQYQSTTAYPSQGFAPPGSVGAAAAAGGAEEDRGVLGALGGAAVGGYTGHKMHHGFLGALGGAIAGHKLEDTIKEHKRKEEEQRKRKEREEEEQRRRRYQQEQLLLHQQQHSHSEPLPGNFSASSVDITLDRDCELIARCANIQGHQRLSSISLNDCLVNDGGHLRWARDGGFGHSARNVRLVDGGRVLEAELGDGHGGWNYQRIRLDERISNQDGKLELLD